MFEPPPLPAGHVIAGKLRVVRQLGAGGMGAVYEVEHEFTKHRRALKLLHSEMLAHPTVVARFLREASAAGHIGNPHIVETFDAGTLESGAPYIVMEMLQGETLAARLSRKKKLPLGELADLVLQACEGVQAAHAAGIVHRDLKPENLFIVERDGRPFVKILDFGISKFDSALTGGHGSTKEGHALGTPYYMSPEQVDGEKDLDARADVYALGVILYECATGERPFVADALPKLSVLIHQGTPTPVSDLRPDLPAAFAVVVQKAMARDRTRRYASARELADDLVPLGEQALDSTLPETTAPRAGLDSRPPQARSNPPPANEPKLSARSVGGATLSVAESTPPPRGGARRLGWVAAAGVLLIGSGVAMLKLGRGPLVSPPPVPAIPVAAQAPVTPPIPSAPVPLVTLAPEATAPSASAGVATAPAGGGKTGKAAPSPSASAKPAVTGTRVDQTGLAGDNPFK